MCTREAQPANAARGKDLLGRTQLVYEAKQTAGMVSSYLDLPRGFASRSVGPHIRPTSSVQRRAARQHSHADHCKFDAIRETMSLALPDLSCRCQGCLILKSKERKGNPKAAARRSRKKAIHGAVFNQPLFSPCALGNSSLHRFRSHVGSHHAPPADSSLL